MLPPATSSQRKVAIAIDSTGLKVYGEGEWKVRRHGACKRRTWRKPHIGIDVQTQEIVLAELTSNSEDDAAVAAELLQGQSDRPSSFRGDGAYGDFKLRETLGNQVKQIIPPPKDVMVRRDTKEKPLAEYLQQWNEAVAFIEQQSLENKRRLPLAKFE